MQIIEKIDIKQTLMSRLDNLNGLLPFDLKNAPSKLQKIKNNIFNPYIHFIIIYIDDVLIYSNTNEQPFKHLAQFHKIAKINGNIQSKK